MYSSSRRYASQTDNTADKRMEVPDQVNTRQPEPPIASPTLAEFCYPTSSQITERILDGYHSDSYRYGNRRVCPVVAS